MYPLHNQHPHHHRQEEEGQPNRHAQNRSNSSNNNDANHHHHHNASWMVRARNDQGIALMAAGDHAAAIRVFRTALQELPALAAAVGQEAAATGSADDATTTSTVSTAAASSSTIQPLVQAPQHKGQHDHVVAQQPVQQQPLIHPLPTSILGNRHPAIVADRVAAQDLFSECFMLIPHPTITATFLNGNPNDDPMRMDGAAMANGGGAEEAAPRLEDSNHTTHDTSNVRTLPDDDICLATTVLLFNLGLCHHLRSFHQRQQHPLHHHHHQQQQQEAQEQQQFRQQGGDSDNTNMASRSGGDNCNNINDDENQDADMAIEGDDDDVQDEEQRQPQPQHPPSFSNGADNDLQKARRFYKLALDTGCDFLIKIVQEQQQQHRRDPSLKDEQQIPQSERRPQEHEEEHEQGTTMHTSSTSDTSPSLNTNSTAGSFCSHNNSAAWLIILSLANNLGCIAFQTDNYIQLEECLSMGNLALEYIHLPLFWANRDKWSNPSAAA